MFVSENVAQGVTKSAIATSTSLLRKSWKTSAQNARKLSLASLLSGPGAGIPAKIATGAKMRTAMTPAANVGDRRRVNSPPTNAMMPNPAVFEIVIHALSWFSWSLRETVDNHPARAL
jgi:hypothetical protein